MVHYVVILHCLYIFWLNQCLYVVFMPHHMAVCVLLMSGPPCVCRIDGSEAVFVVQTVLPDIVAFAASVITFTCCRMLPLHRVVPDGEIPPSADGVAQNHRMSFASVPGRRNVPLLTPSQWKCVGVTLTIVMVAACGVVHPSLLNTLYFVTTLIVATSWALRIGSRMGGGRGLQRLRALLLIYTAAYLILMYICQFPFAHQHMWVEDHLVIGGTVERYIHCQD